MKSLEHLTIIYIYVHSRSGSSLLQSMLDGHKNVAFVPSGFFDSYEFFSSRMDLSLDMLCESFFRDPYVNKFSTANNFFYSKNTLSFDTQKFKDVFIPAAARQRSVKNYIESFYAAIAACFNFTNVTHIVEHIHSNPSELYLKEREAIFKNVFIVHMFRDMSNAIVSHIRLRQKLNNTAVNYVLGLLEAYKFGMKNYFLHKDLANYITLRLEDLHMDPDVCMKDLCERVGLEFTPSLLKATFMGKAWEYESAKGDLMREVQKEITYDALSQEEQLAFETMFAPLYLAAGYKLCTKADMSQSAICRAELLGDSRVNLFNLLSFHYSYEYSHLLTVPVLRFLERLRVLKPLIIFRRFVKNIVFILRYKAKKCAVVESVLALRDEIRAANGRSSGAGSSTGSGAGSNVGSSTGSNSAQGAQEAQGKQTAQDAAGFMGAGANFAGSNATRSSTGSGAGSSTRSSAPAQNAAAGKAQSGAQNG